MSFRAIAEFILHIEHFRNVDLFQQGLYFLKFQLFNEDPEKIYYANPYDFTSKDYESKQKGKANFHRLQEPQIYDESASFMTKTFFIRYAEEIVVIRDMVKFRTEVNVQPGYLNTEFYLKCDLYYSCPPQHNFSASIGSAEIMRDEVNKNTTKVKVVQTKIFQINSQILGQSVFIPISFDREFTSVCACTIHGSMIDFRFRVKNARLEDQHADDASSTFMENGILVEKKITNDEQVEVKQTNRKSDIKWAPHNVAEYFFFDEFGFLNISDRRIFECYGEFTAVLAEVYNNLKNIYEKLSHKVITEEDLEEIDFPRLPKDIEQRGLEYYLDNEMKERARSPEKKIIKAIQIVKEIEVVEQEEAEVNHQFGCEEEQSTLSSAVQKDLGYNGGSERSEFESPDANVFSEGLEDSEESKKAPVIPVLKTNLKEGRVNMNVEKKKGLASLEEYKMNEIFILKDQNCLVNDPQKIGNAIVMEINFMAGQLFELSNDLSRLVISKAKKVYKLLLDDYQRRLQEKYGENILRHVIQTQDFSFPSEDYTGQLNDIVAKKTREVLQIHQEIAGHEVMPVEEVKIEEEVLEGRKKNRKKRNMEKYAPLIFEECYIKQPKGFVKAANTFEISSDSKIEQQINPQKGGIERYKGIHLFVMCHGFQGSSFDMRMFKNIISIALPEAQFLCSSANEEDTEGSVFDMGYKLAQEVHQFVRESCPGHHLARLTFIGHSLGGLIIRASLPYLEKFKDRMHGYLSLCSPHLGYMYKSSKIFSAGMWVLKKWKKSLCLQQLSMTDHKQLEKTALFELSKQDGFNWFKHIILVSSFQDQYAPFDSARVQICSDAAKDILKGNAYIQMVNNLLSDIPLEVLYRLDVNFQISETNIDSLIGRTAHILFLENEELMKMITSRYKDFFS